MYEHLPPDPQTLSPDELAIEFSMLQKDFEDPPYEHEQFRAAKGSLYTTLGSVLQRNAPLSNRDHAIIDGLLDDASDCFLGILQTAMDEDERISLAGRLIHEAATELQQFGEQHGRGDIIDPQTIQDCIDGVKTVLDFSSKGTYNYCLALSFRRYFEYPIELLLSGDY